MASLNFIQFSSAFTSLPYVVLPGFLYPHLSFTSHSQCVWAKVECNFSAPKDGLKSFLKSPAMYWCLEYFATLNLLLSFCHVSYLILPISFHICTSCPSDIMWEYNLYSRSLMKTLINMRSHAVVASSQLHVFVQLLLLLLYHQSGLGEHGTPAEVWERRQSHEGGSGMPLAALPSFPIMCIHPFHPSCLLVCQAIQREWLDQQGWGMTMQEHHIISTALSQFLPPNILLCSFGKHDP